MKKLTMSTKTIKGQFVKSIKGYVIWTLVLFMILSTSAHKRGPHHPRSPIASSNHNHNHYVPLDKNLLHDKEHIKEDMGEWILDGKDLSPEEMEFHYFKMHDFDNNSMLDGLEILQAISHVLPVSDADAEPVDLTASGSPQLPTRDSQQQHPHKPLTREEQIKQKEEDFNYYIDLIDKVLEEDDMNKDGYLSYFEYVVGRRREENKENVLHSSNPKTH